ncbi:hypothetical protein [Paracoccus sanguinis]|uniref:hypothetical protein n=1 Tax=Paracoccus sanguinis TaxID=1545044 RepID=UPI0012E0341F|nr:hypothetical protein [Paracoccus sanguinis]
MSEFNSMTVSAACRLFERPHTVATLDSQLVEWGIYSDIPSGSKPAKLVSLARAAIERNPQVPTEVGQVPLDRAIIQAVLGSLNSAQRSGDDWRKFIAGLRMDGFEVTGLPDEAEDDFPWMSSRQTVPLELRRMLPADATGLDVREAEDELSYLLNQHRFTDAASHLTQAVSAFSRGDWAASNAQIRTFYEDLLSQMSVRLGCNPSANSAEKRTYLASADSGPFFFADYNEWENERGKPSYVQGLWARLHPQGSHPGLSEEDDCAFRLQTVLIAARLFMRRFDRRVSSAP